MKLYKYKIYKEIVILSALIGAILITLGFIYSKNDIPKSMLPQAKEIQPIDMIYLNPRTAQYNFQFQFKEEDKLCLHFVSDNQTVQIYHGTELIYSVERGKTCIGRTPGKIFHFVKLPASKSKITLVLKNQYHKLDGQLPKFWVGDRHRIFKARIQHALAPVVVYMLIFLIGIAMLLYWYMVRKQLKRSKESLYFSMLLIVLGLWFVRGSEFISLVVPNYFALTYMGYILFLQIPLLAFSFSVCFWNVKMPGWMKNIYFGISIGNMILCIILHMLKIKDFRQIVFLTHLLLLFAFLCMYAGMYSYFRKNGVDYKIKASSIPMLLLFISMIFDFLDFYTNTIDSYRVGGVVILFFVTCITWCVLYDLSIQLKEGQENAIYKKLAVTDLLTGFYNRNAYESWEKENKNDCSNIYMAICDLNNLKYYNDTLGHEIGDKYIIDAAHLIREALGSDGKCYRIGGDEFLIIWKNKDDSMIEKWSKQLIQLQEEYNASSENICMQIACGYAKKEKADSSILDMKKRADQMMYRNKKSLKINH